MSLRVNIDLLDPVNGFQYTIVGTEEEAEKAKCNKLGGKNTNKEHPESRKKIDEKQYDRKIIHEPLLTVDQLSAHRRGKPAIALPTDNLELPQGSLKNVSTEYQHCFREFEPHLITVSLKKPETDSLKLEGEQEFESEYEKSYVQVPESLYRPRLIRRCTNLKLEGDYYHLTNYRENFIKFVLQERVHLQRRATTLKLLGQMNLETENRRNFVLYQNVFRPPLCKKLTNLHLSGSLHMETENRDNFLQYKVQKQHPLTKMPTNLHLEGTLFLQPEYTSAFVEYKNYEKSKPSLPVDHIKSPIDFVFDKNEYESVLHPLIPHLRSYLAEPLEGPEKSSARSLSSPHSRPPSRPPSRNLGRFVDMHVEDQPRTDKKTYGAPTIVYGEIKKGPHKIYAPISSGSKWGSRSRAQSVSPEFRSPRHAYRDETSAKAKSKDIPPQSRRGTWRSKSSMGTTDVITSKIPTSPQLEGRFECQPEYSKAYINYITREKNYDEKRPYVERIVPDDEVEVHRPPSRGKLKGTVKSSPKDTKKKLDVMETVAFGNKCEASFTSEMSSSEEVLTSKPKKSLTPRSVKTGTTKKKKLGENGGVSDVEPAFIVMD